jgi:cytochrome c oxidase cbb3-type subunit 3
MKVGAALPCLLLALAGFFACRREERRFSEPPPARARHERAASAAPVGDTSHYLDNAWSVSEGQRLFTWFNCAGCHGLAGGGGMGPPLRDASWAYGGTAADVRRSIIEGRPNGMPAFGGRVPDYQTWQLTAYVLSLSGRLRQDVAPGRSETIPLGVPPVMLKERPPLRADVSGVGR